MTGRTLLIGGNSLIAGPVIDGLSANPLTVTTRPSKTPRPDLDHAVLDLRKDLPERAWWDRFDRIVCLAPIHLAQAILPSVADQRAVFVSSNNTALLSDNPNYAPLREAESAILASNLRSVILQPTVISARANDPVTGPMLSRIEAGRPVWLPGATTRQTPLHYLDLARAILHAIDTDPEPGRYSVSGRDTLAYRDMARCLGAAVGRRASRVGLPAAPIRLAAHVWPISRSRYAAQMRRVGIHRDPINPPLPGFEPEYGYHDIVQSLIDARTAPS
ncbi:MAG: hypothetical protein WBF53_06475 [Litorimonas sp.]